MIRRSTSYGPAGALLALSALLSTWPHGASADTLTITSQNCLHLGWAASANKTTALTAAFAHSDIVLLQEVMAQANVATVAGPPGTFKILPAAQAPWPAGTLKGSSSYKEAYVFLVESSLPVTPVLNYPDPNNDFSRAPSGILVKTGADPTWFVNYHAVFGKSKRTRQAEVARMADVYVWYQNAVVSGQTYPRVVIGGDWNLPVEDAAFDPLAAAGSDMYFDPQTPTSLKSNGGLSSPYDHFVWDEGLLDMGDCEVVDPTTINPTYTTKYWRDWVSDHLGIACDLVI